MPRQVLHFQTSCPIITSTVHGFTTTVEFSNPSEKFQVEIGYFIQILSGSYTPMCGQLSCVSLWFNPNFQQTLNEIVDNFRFQL